MLFYSNFEVSFLVLFLNLASNFTHLFPILASFSKEMSHFDITIKSFLKEKMYFSKDVLKKTNMGKKIIKFLFLNIKKNPSKFIKKSIYQKKNFERNICDFIAGMTDRYAINLYNSLK